MSAPQCNGCRFWRLNESTIDEFDVNWGFGFCRRKPPTLVDSLIAAEIVPPRYGQQSDLDRPGPLKAFPASAWPSTFSTEWCGEHHPAPEGGA